VGTAHETDGGHGPKLNDSKLNILLDFKNTILTLYGAAQNFA
jgi:hypothetical protein